MSKFLYVFLLGHLCLASAASANSFSEDRCGIALANSVEPACYAQLNPHAITCGPHNTPITPIYSIQQMSSGEKDNCDNNKVPMICQDSGHGGLIIKPALQQATSGRQF